jgi:HAD superfamily hydrolase (TIGR01509 family)
MLKAFYDKGITLALCTSSNRELTFRLLERIGIQDLFQVVVAKGDYSKRKPDPEPYMVTAEKLGVEPSEVIAW